MIKKINKGDWSGKKALIKINKTKKTVSIYDGDHTFEIIKVKKIKDMWEVWNKDNSDFPFCNVFKVDTWYVADNGSCTRESNCIYEAVAQLAFNLI